MTELNCLRLAHRAVNNLGVLTSQILLDPGLEAGSYRNSFTAIPAGVRVVPTRLPRPLASGTQTAIVVGSASQVITSTRDHQEHYYTTKLEDAIIVDIKDYMHNCQDPSNSHFTHLEDVEFTYRKITWTHEVCGTSGSDDWRSPVAG